MCTQLSNGNLCITMWTLILVYHASCVDKSFLRICELLSHQVRWLTLMLHEKVEPFRHVVGGLQGAVTFVASVQNWEQSLADFPCRQPQFLPCTSRLHSVSVQERENMLSNLTVIGNTTTPVSLASSVSYEAIYVGIRGLQSVIGAAGNALTLIILSKLKSLSNGHILMVYLAISDLLICLAAPFSLALTIVRVTGQKVSAWYTYCIAKEGFFSIGIGSTLTCYAVLSFDRWVKCLWYERQIGGPHGKLSSCFCLNNGVCSFFMFTGQIFCGAGYDVRLLFEVSAPQHRIDNDPWWASLAQL